MKYFILSTAFILIIVFTANSQITKGNWMLGGSFSISKTNYNSQYYGLPHSETNYTIRPDIGYFFFNKLSAGLKSNISKSWTGQGLGEKYTDFALGPFIRYYFLKEDKIVNVLTEAGYQYGFIRVNGQDGYSNKNIFNFSAGPVLFFNSSVALETLLNYTNYKFSNFKGSNEIIYFSIGLHVHLEKE